MKYIKKTKKIHLTGKETFEGNSIEQDMRIATQTKQMPNINKINVFHTRKQDEVLPEIDIRTDRFEMAQNAMQHVNNEFHKKIKESIKNQVEQSQATDVN